MRNDKYSYIGVLVASFMIIALAMSPAVAQRRPPAIPHGFYGTATVNDTPIPEGATITAVVGEDEFTTEVGEDGHYTLKVPPDGEVDIYIRDFPVAEGLEIEEGQVERLDLEVDDDVPPTLTVEEPPEMTGEEALTIRGEVEDDFALPEEIVLLVNDEQAPVDPDGTFEVDVALDAGVNEITVEAVDLAGNSAEEAFEVILDEEAPEIEVTTPEEDEGFRTTSVEVAGTVTDDWTPEEEIILLVNDEEVSVGPDGSFETTVSLDEGPQTVSVVAEDLVGNSSTVDVSVMVDVESPDLTILSPSDGDEIPEQEIEVEGVVDDDWTEPEDIIVTVEGEEVTVDSDGNFSTVVELEMGTNNISATATDEVGNSTTETVTVERVDPVPWALYGAIIAIIAIVLAIIAIWRQKASKEGM